MTGLQSDPIIHIFVAVVIGWVVGGVIVPEPAMATVATQLLLMALFGFVAWAATAGLQIWLYGDGGRP